jgi:hypothetical protein
MSMRKLNNEVNADDVPSVCWSLCRMKLSMFDSVATWSNCRGCRSWCRVWCIWISAATSSCMLWAWMSWSGLHVQWCVYCDVAPQCKVFVFRDIDLTSEHEYPITFRPLYTLDCAFLARSDYWWYSKTIVPSLLVPSLPNMEVHWASEGAIGSCRPIPMWVIVLARCQCPWWLTWPDSQGQNIDRECQASLGGQCDTEAVVIATLLF